MVPTQQCVCIHVCVHIYSNVLKSWPFTTLIVDQWTMYIRREEGSKQTVTLFVQQVHCMKEQWLSINVIAWMQHSTHYVVLHGIIRFIIHVIVFIE